MSFKEITALVVNTYKRFAVETRLIISLYSFLLLYFFDVKPESGLFLVVFIAIGFSFIEFFKKDQHSEDEIFPRYFGIAFSYVFYILLPFMVFFSIQSFFGKAGSIIELDYAIDELSKKSDYIKLQKIRDNFIIIEDEKKECKTYELNIESSKIFKQQEFSIMQYTRSKEDQLMTDKTFWENTCWLLKNRDMKLPLSILGDNVSNMEIIQAFQNIMAEVNKKKGSLSIYVKGYADKESSKWKRPINDNYNYSLIPYYKAVDSFKSSYSISDSTLSTFTISGHESGKIDGYYNNDDLPYLRAKYVLENYVNNFLTKCTQEPIKKGILEGVVLDKKTPQNRNTELYITLCTDKPVLGCAGPTQ